MGGQVTEFKEAEFKYVTCGVRDDESMELKQGLVDCADSERCSSEITRSIQLTTLSQNLTMNY